MIRTTCFFLFSIALPATEIELDLAIQAGSTTAMTYRIGTNLNNPTASQDSYNQELTYSGNILANVEVDASDGSIETIRFSGGTINTENITDFLNVFVGQTAFQITFRTLGITRTTLSTETETVSSNGFLDGGLHTTPFTGGTIEIANFPADTASPSVTEVTDLSEEVSELISSSSLFPDFENLISIGTTEVSSNLLRRTFNVRLFTQILVPVLSPDATIQAAGQASNQQFTQRYVENGSLAAEDTFTLPTPFGQWALDENIEILNGNEVNASNIPYVLLFALGLDSEAASLPLTFSKGAPVVAQLALPAEGLGFEVIVEYSPNLEDDFEELDPSFLLDGTNSLKARRTGNPRIAFPEGEQGYLRFTVSRPNF